VEDVAVTRAIAAPVVAAIPAPIAAPVAATPTLPVTTIATLPVTAVAILPVAVVAARTGAAAIVLAPVRATGLTIVTTVAACVRAACLAVSAVRPAVTAALLGTPSPILAILRVAAPPALAILAGGSRDCIGLDLRRRVAPDLAALEIGSTLTAIAPLEIGAAALPDCCRGLELPRGLSLRCLRPGGFLTGRLATATLAAALPAAAPLSAAAASIAVLRTARLASMILCEDRDRHQRGRRHDRGKQCPMHRDTPKTPGRRSAR